MDLIQLAREIASSGDVYSNFHDMTKGLTKQQIVTVAREVNKLLFTHALNNSELNQNIEFNVLNVDGMSKKDNQSNNNGKSLKKTASAINEEIVEQKKELIKVAMFNLKPEEKRLEKFRTTNTILTDRTMEKIAHEATQKEIERQTKTQKEFEQKKAECKLVKGAVLEKIASLTNDPSVMRTIVKEMVEEGLEKEAKEVIDFSRLTNEQIVKVASYNLDGYQKEKLDEHIAQCKRANALMDRLESMDNTEKTAGLIHIPINITKHILYGVGKAGNKTISTVKNLAKNRPALLVGIPAVGVAGYYGGIDRFLTHSDNISDAVVEGY